MFKISFSKLNIYIHFIQSVMLVLEAVTKVLQSQEKIGSFNNERTVPSYLELAKKTWLESRQFERVFQDFDFKAQDHARLIGIIEPFLEQKSFHAIDAAKTSKVTPMSVCEYICLFK